MQLKVFTLKFDSLYGGFNDEIVQAFTKDKEIISIKDYFFTRNDVPYLTLIIQYILDHSKFEPGGSTPGKKKRTHFQGPPAKETTA
jgi:hypothetical protein